MPGWILAPARSDGCPPLTIPFCPPEESCCGAWACCCKEDEAMYILLGWAKKRTNYFKDMVRGQCIKGKWVNRKFSSQWESPKYF